MNTRNERIRYLRKNIFHMSRDDFSNAIGQKSRGKIVNIELRDQEVGDELIDLICKIYPEVNKEWLSDGVGEPLRDKTREEEIAEYAASIIKEQDSFKLRLIEALIKLDEAGWNKIKEIIEYISTQ